MARHDLLAADELFAIENVVEAAFDRAVLPVTAMAMDVENRERFAGEIGQRFLARRGSRAEEDGCQDKDRPAVTNALARCFVSC